MASTPGKSGVYAGSMTVRGNNLRNSLGNVDISGLYNSTSDSSGVLTRQAQDEAIANQIMASIEAENAAAAEANTGGPKTDFPGANYDPTSDSIGGYAVDLGSVYSLFPDAVTSAVTAAMQNDYLNSILETQLTPEEKEAQRLGLSVAQMNAKTEDMLDSILNSQGGNETGFVNESARIAAEGILKGKIAQAGVTDPVAQEAALKSAMESLEGGASGLEAVKAAAGGAKDYVEELLKTAKDILDKGYDDTIAKLPKILVPETITFDPTTGQVNAVFEIGDEGSPPLGGSAPIFGGQVGTVNGGTQVGVTTTGNAVLDAIIKAAKDGVDQQDIEDVVGAIISTTTGISKDIVDAGIGGAKDAIKAAKTVIGSSVTGEDDDDATNIAIGSGAVTTRTCEDGSLVGINDLCPEEIKNISTITGGDGTGTSTVDPSATNVEFDCYNKDGTDTARSTNGVCPATHPYTSPPPDTSLEDDTIDTIIAGSVCGKGQINVNGTCVNSRDTQICPSGDIIMKGETCPTVVVDKCPEGSKLAGQPIPADGNCNPTVVVDKCPEGSKLAGQPIPADKNCNPSGPPIVEDKCPPGSILAGQAIPADKNCNPGGGPPVVLEEKCPPGTILAGQAIPADKNCNPGGGIVVTEDDTDTGSGVPLTTTTRVNPAVRAIAGDVVDIDYLYDIGGPSIFAPTMQMDEDKNRPYIYSGFADGGIVKEYDLEQLLKKIRG